MKVAIVGSKGYIAQYIKKKLNQLSYVDEVIQIDKEMASDVLYLDLESPDKFDLSFIKDAEYVIFTAAISSPDICSKSFDLCWSVNVEGTIKIIHKAIEQGKKVLFFSSDAVFGKDCDIFDENSETNATTPYGIMKKTVEDRFKDNACFKAIRLSYVISKSDKFVNYCLSCLENKQQAEIYHPFYRNCITITNVVDVVIWLILNWEAYPHNMLNVCGRELISRVRIADEINRYFENRLRYRIITPDKDFYNNRPSVTQMQSLYLYKERIVKDESFTTCFFREMESVQL